MNTELRNARSIIQLSLCVAFTVILAHFAGDDSNALPMFARRYGVPCATCHTSPPRLNETGYNFRAAGFRMPDEIGTGVERSFKPTDHVGFRLQPRYDAHRTSVGSGSHTWHRANLFAAEGYFWYGPISKYFSSNLKVTAWPEESGETEFNERVEGNIRFNYGSSDNFIDIRGGVPHPMEGFAGSEYYVASNTRPLIQEQGTASFDQDTFFAPMSLHQAGITVGYHYKRTTVRGLILSGMRLDVDDEEGKVEGFGRKEPFTKALSPSNRGGPDFQLFFNQVLHPDGGGVSLCFYKGQSFLPRLDLLSASSVSEDPAESEPSLARTLALRPSAGRIGNPLQAQALNTSLNPAALEAAPFFENDFYRLAFYAGYPIKKVNLLYGIQRGRDTIGSGGHFASLGQFAEVMARVTDLSAVGIRYDWFDPARNKERNEINGFTPYVNVWLHSELRIAAEYRHLNARQGRLQPSRKDDVFQLRLYWVR